MRRDEDFALARRHCHILISRHLDISMLRLHLHLALRGDELQADLFLDAIDEQADVLPDVVQPASSARLIGIALSDEVEVGAGRQREILPGQSRDTCRGGEDHDRLPARFGMLCLGGLYVFCSTGRLVGIRPVFPRFERLDMVLQMPAGDGSSWQLRAERRWRRCG